MEEMELGRERWKKEGTKECRGMMEERRDERVEGMMEEEMIHKFKCKLKCKSKFNLNVDVEINANVNLNVN